MLSTLFRVRFRKALRLCVKLILPRSQRKALAPRRKESQSGGRILQSYQRCRRLVTCHWSLVTRHCFSALAEVDLFVIEVVGGVHINEDAVRVGELPLEARRETQVQAARRDYRLLRHQRPGGNN